VPAISSAVMASSGSEDVILRVADGPRGFLVFLESWVICCVDVILR
jgi:hypothetical protein